MATYKVHMRWFHGDTRHTRVACMRTTRVIAKSPNHAVRRARLVYDSIFDKNDCRTEVIKQHLVGKTWCDNHAPVARWPD